jgi:nitric oxide reductase large subunit
MSGDIGVGVQRKAMYTGTTGAAQSGAFAFVTILALGATFSALEVVPLVLIGFEGYENLTLAYARPWVSAYKWPIYFFVAVAFWNLVGAGLFGFLINPPIALYYMQGLNRSTDIRPCLASTACWALDWRCFASRGWRPTTNGEPVCWYSASGRSTSAWP